MLLSIQSTFTISYIRLYDIYIYDKFDLFIISLYINLGRKKIETFSAEIVHYFTSQCTSRYACGRFGNTSVKYTHTHTIYAEIV